MINCGWIVICWGGFGILFGDNGFGLVRRLEGVWIVSGLKGKICLGSWLFVDDYCFGYVVEVEVDWGDRFRSWEVFVEDWDFVDCFVIEWMCWGLFWFVVFFLVIVCLMCGFLWGVWWLCKSCIVVMKGWLNCCSFCNGLFFWSMWVFCWMKIWWGNIVFVKGNCVWFFEDFIVVFVWWMLYLCYVLFGSGGVFFCMLGFWFKFCWCLCGMWNLLFLYE